MSTKISPEQRRYWAEKLGGLNEQYLYQCLTGRRDMNPGEARRIERDSGGVITRQMLCQKTWHEIWPELALLQEIRAQDAIETVATANAFGLERRQTNTPQNPDHERRAPLAAALANHTGV